jgi:pre-mRNA-processing factor 39
MTAAQDGATEWEKTWGKVIKDPEDFSSWETLVKLAEGVAGGLTRDSPDQDRANLKTVYDHFLSKFPLCFGYWKKYADWELAFYGAPQAKEVHLSLGNQC